MRFLEKKALSSGLKYLFVLTTQSEHFFIENGYIESSPENLPEGKKSLYNYQRNSKVLSKELS